MNAGTSEPSAPIQRAVNLRAYLSDSAAVPAAITVTVVAIFLPTLIVPYAFSDDYLLLALVNHLGLSDPAYPRSIMDAAVVNGRPLAGLFDTFFFGTARTIGNLRFVRVAGLLGIVAVALSLYWALGRSGLKRAPAALIAVLICSMPAFQVYGSWADLFPSPYAALLGAWASVLAVGAARSDATDPIDRLVVATGLLLAALLIYQPAAMFFWVFLAIALAGAVQQQRHAWPIVRTHLTVAVFALGLAFLMVKLGAHTVGTSAPNAARNDLTHDLGGKIHWFVEQPLYRSANLFDLTPSLWFAALVAAVAITGISLKLRQAESRLLYIAVGIALIPLTYLPNLVVAENFATFRTQVSLSSLLALYFSLGALGIWLSVREKLQARRSQYAVIAIDRLTQTIAIAFVATSALAAANNVNSLFVEPQITELRMIRNQVTALPPGVQRVAFIQTGYYGGMTKLVLDDEFGVPSSTPWYTAEPLVLLTLRESGRLGMPRPIIDRFSADTVRVPQGEPTIDVRGLERLR